MAVIFNLRVRQEPYHVCLTSDRFSRPLLSWKQGICPHQDCLDLFFAGSSKRKTRSREVYEKTGSLSKSNLRNFGFTICLSDMKLLCIHCKWHTVCYMQWCCYLAIGILSAKYCGVTTVHHGVVFFISGSGGGSAGVLF